MASMWPTLVNDPCVFEKDEYSAGVGWSAL